MEHHRNRGVIYAKVPIKNSITKLVMLSGVLMRVDTNLQGAFCMIAYTFCTPQIRSFFQLIHISTNDTCPYQSISTFYQSTLLIHFGNLFYPIADNKNNKRQHIYSNALPTIPIFTKIHVPGNRLSYSLSLDPLALRRCLSAGLPIIIYNYTMPSICCQRLTKYFYNYCHII